MKTVAEMSKSEKDRYLAWLKNWDELGPILEGIRLRSLKHVNTRDAILAMDGAYKSARLHLPQRKSSGLVEQQRLFKRVRK
jgi:hypothetical protein